MPRRLIYGQAALLGASAITFFLLGMMVGHLTAPSQIESAFAATSSSFVADCRVRGSVVFKRRGRSEPDVGSVVILLPKRTKPEQPLAPGLVMPETFVALDNPTIDSIHRTGGAIVRTDSSGKFDVLVDQNREYRLLVLSKKRQSTGRKILNSQQLVLAKWFAPTEKLIRDNDFRWKDIHTTGEKVTVGVIEFD